MADQKAKRIKDGAVRRRIESLLDPEKSTNEIAAAVDCHPTYVHTIAKAKGVELRAVVNLGHPKVNGVWTEERIELLRKLWCDDKLAAPLIVPHFKGVFTRNAIIGKIHRMGWAGQAKIGRPSIKRVANPVGPRRKPRHRPAAPGVSQPVAPYFKADFDIPPPRESDVARKTFQQLQTGECKFPIGEPGQAGFGFCAEEALPEQPYCAHHHSRCYVGVAGRKPQVPANDREKVEA